MSALLFTDADGENIIATNFTIRETQGRVCVIANGQEVTIPGLEFMMAAQEIGKSGVVDLSVRRQIILDR